MRDNKVKNINEKVLQFFEDNNIATDNIKKLWLSKENQLSLYNSLTLPKNNMPKKYTSSYLYFCSENRDIIKEELSKKLGQNPKCSVITKELGFRWNELKQTGNIEKYEKLAELDKQRYLKEKKSLDEKKPETKPEKKVETKPEKKVDNLNKYQRFCAIKRPQLKLEYPNQKAVEITKKLSDAWKKLSHEEKDKF